MTGMTLSSIPKTQKVIKCHGPGSASLVQDGPVPDYPAYYILVKVEAVALNPTDWKHIHNQVIRIPSAAIIQTQSQLSAPM